MDLNRLQGAEATDRAQVAHSKAITQPPLSLRCDSVVVLMAVVVLPPLVEVFRQFGSELPLTTKVLIAITDFIANYKYFLLGIIALIVLVLVVLFRHPRPEKRWIESCCNSR